MQCTSHDLVFKIIRNVSCAANQHIKMISEGSRDTGNWSNDDIIGINNILKYIEILFILN